MARQIVVGGQGCACVTTYGPHGGLESSRTLLRQLQGPAQSLGGVAVRLSRTAFELLDAMHAQAGPFGQGILGEPKREAMLPQERAETVGCLTRLDSPSRHLCALSACRTQASPD